MTDRHRLIVMRHAKAEPFGASDHDRNLTERGTLAAHDAGVHLGQEGLRPDYALVSSARRAVETWAQVESALAPLSCETHIEDELFSAGPDVLLEALKAVPQTTGTVMFVGHNPTAAYVCHLLDDGSGDPASTSGMLQGFPPGAIAVLELTGDWSDLDVESCRLVGFHVGGA